MTDAEVEALSKVLGKVVREKLDELGNVVREKVDGLEARVDALERAPQLKMRGLWKASETYAPGDVVTHHDGTLLWICRADSAGEPGNDYAGWVLAA